MTYRVELTERAVRDLRRLYRTINAGNSSQAREWFAGIELAVSSLDTHPGRGAIIPEDDTLRHLLYGRGRNIYRIIYAINEQSQIVVVLHIRHGARDAFPRDAED